MKRIDRFQSLAELRVERDRLRAVRDARQDALRGHWDLLHEKDFRRGLAGDAFGDMLRAWKPMRTLSSFMRSDDGPLGNVLGVLLSSRARGLKGRLFAWAVGLLAPVLLKKYATPERMEHVAQEVRRSWDRVRERIREGRDQ